MSEKELHKSVQLTVDNAASPNSLSSFLIDTIAAVFLFDSLNRNKI